MSELIEILLFSLSCVAPFFIYLLIGYSSKSLLHIKDESFIDINKLSFYVFLPATLFLNIYNAKLKEIDFGAPVIFSMSCVAVVVAILWFYYGNRKLPAKDKGVLIQAIFRTNFILFGIPMTELITGNPATGMAGVMTAVVIPSFNVLAVIVLAIYSNTKPSPLAVLKKMTKNPLILASFFGILTNLTGIHFGDFILYILKILATTAIPVSLIALGGRFDFTRYEGGKYVLAESIVLRLILIPAIVTGAAALLGFRGETLALILVLFATPPSTSSYTMAQQMGCNDRLAAKILVYGTTLSSITLFLFISVFKMLELV